VSREIKFRAWDLKHKKWLDFDYPCDFHMNPLTGKIQEDMDNSCSDPECCGGPSPMWRDQEGYIVEQFTGLHDKNGKEIYEGDIVRLGLGEVVWDEEEAGFHLRWHDRRFRDARASIIQRHDGHEPIFANAKYSLEVIGNIHENPELLK
jgi:uncharacterized phage protein (TIGR01671 family)